MSVNKKQKQDKEISIKERNSIFDFSGEFSNLSLDEKKKTYLILIKYLLIKNRINIKRIENERLIGNYKNIGLNVKCLFRQSCYMIMKNDVKKFEKELNEENGIIGFLVSNVYISDEAIERVKNNDKIYLCHENELVNDIKVVKNLKYNSLKDITEELDLNDGDSELKYLIEEINFLDDFQNFISERKELFLNKIKTKILF
ncbi:8361_t:CDS:2 [Scutellospora calospora]|uniref:8361_t:CDS:1 n=1 Tax=Scutellospora calospora TaxID=85575 RepID=A0ACA9JZE2_9GLOM|nr:8361_t:CDS:2 [Scutellospora calospora]